MVMALRVKKRDVKSRSRRLLKKKVFDHSARISEQLNYTCLLPYLLTTKYTFLSDEELQKLEELPTNQQKNGRLLAILKTKSSRAVRRFLACVFDEKEHLGHEDLSKLFKSELPPGEVEKVQLLMEKPNTSPNTSHVGVNYCYHCNRRLELAGREQAHNSSVALVKYASTGPEFPMKLIEYEGCLIRDYYVKLDRKLWWCFSNGNYDELAVLTERINISTKMPIDVKIIGRWFESLISMHRDSDYERCLRDILKPALDMCSESNVQNRNVLEGRICQRMAQIFLVMGRKEEAVEYLDRAKELLQFVARGYEQVNMLCREAKIMCATMPEKRKETEEMFCKALESVSEDDSFALASIPSIILSKAAFHLRISFGSKPSYSDVDKVLIPRISAEDESKAREVFKRLPSNKVLLAMRKSEHKFICGELMRLDGKTDSAIKIFEEVVCESKAAKLDNIVANAQHRIQVIQMERECDDAMEEILEGTSDPPL